MSPVVSPSPPPLSGWFDVIDVSTKPGFGLQTSLTATVAVMGTSLWFGGQSTFGLTVKLIEGAWVSCTVTVAEQLRWFPLSSRAVNCTTVGPRPKNEGAVSVMATLGSQMSLADTPAKNAASCASPADTPRLPVHSTVTSDGHVIDGSVRSRTLTVALQVSVRLPASVAVNVTDVVTFTGKSPGALLVIVGAASRPTASDTPATHPLSCESPAGVHPEAEHSTVLLPGQVMFGAKFTGSLAPMSTPPAW